ncbi:MAG: hypothetical protein EBS76_11730, partial [Actinobacteria bacterium]|nr:hypothetical protein [Actinomycetota bacterium]
FARAETDAGGSLTGLYVCEPGQNDWLDYEPTCPDSADPFVTEVINGESYFVLTMREPNLRVSICASGSADCVPVQSHVQLLRYEVYDEYSGNGWWNHISRVSSNEDGDVNFVLNESGDYRFILESNSWGGSTDEARTFIEFSVTANGGVLSIEGLGELNASSGRYELFYAEPTFTARVVSPDDGSAQRWTSIEIFRPMDDCNSCREHIGSFHTNQHGEAGVVLSAGDYTIRLNPSSEARDLGLARTEIDITIRDCNADGDDEVYLRSDPCGTPLTDANGVAALALAGMNFRGTLYASTDESEPVRWAHGNVRIETIDEWSGQTYWEWTDNWFDVQNGKFGIALTRSGKYQIRFEPDYNSQSSGLTTSIE